MQLGEERGCFPPRRQQLWLSGALALCTVRSPPHERDFGAGSERTTGRHWKNAGDLHTQVSSEDGLAINSAGFWKHKHFTSA